MKSTIDRDLIEAFSFKQCLFISRDLNKTVRILTCSEAVDLENFKFQLNNSLAKLG